MKAFFILIVLTKFSINSYSQISHIPYYHILNKCDSLLIEGDTIQALAVYSAEVISSKYTIKKEINRKYSDIYYKKGNIEQAKKEMEKAIIKGLFWTYYIHKSNDDFYELLERRFGNSFKKHLVELNQEVTANKMIKNKNIIKAVNEAYCLDWKLRKEKV